MAEFDNETILAQLRDILRDRPTGNRSGPRQKPIDEFKLNELPDFDGGTDPEEYLEWERKIERMFDFKDVSDEKRCKYAILKLAKNASLWFENLKAKRARERKEKLNSWDTLKRKLRKRYVPKSHKIDLYRKIAELNQGSLSIANYIAKFEKLSLMGELDELEEQKMARFCRGLNINIAYTVDLQNYDSFDVLCRLCLKVENQLKANRSTSGYTPKSNVWTKTEGSRAGGSVPTAAPTATTPKTFVRDKPESSSKEKDLAKVRCFKCQGFGHFRSDCPNKRIVTLREAMDLRDELSYDRAIEEEGLFTLEGGEETDDESLAYEAPIYDTSLVLRRMLHSKNEPLKGEQREQIFHTKCQITDKWCSVIVDGGSCTNVAATELVDKLALVTIPHPKPYTLHWLDDGSKIKVSKQTRVNFAMGPYKDEVLFDVIPMDACHVLLGRPWQFDRDVTHRGRSNDILTIGR